VKIPRPRLPRLRLPRRRDASRRPRGESRPPVTGVLRGARLLALAAIAVLVAAASVASFMQSYRALYEWAHDHGLSAHWSAIWPLQIDVFIAVGELALFVALVDRWQKRARVLPWLVTLAGLAVSVAGNVGHVTNHIRADRITAAVPPLAAAAALAVGLGVLKRVVEHRPQTGQRPADSGGVPSDAVKAATASMRATAAAGNPWSVNQLTEQFSLTRSQATKVRQSVLAESNGHNPE
jgi:hypothetical protein